MQGGVLETTDVALFAGMVEPGDVVVSPRIGGVCDLPAGARRETWPYRVFEGMLETFGIPCFAPERIAEAACMRKIAQDHVSHGSEEEEEQDCIIVGIDCDVFRSEWRIKCLLTLPPAPSS